MATPDQAPDPFVRVELTGHAAATTSVATAIESAFPPPALTTRMKSDVEARRREPIPGLMLWVDTSVQVSPPGSAEVALARAGSDTVVVELSGDTGPKDLVEAYVRGLFESGPSTVVPESDDRRLEVDPSKPAKS